MENLKFNISVNRDRRWLPIGSITYQPDKNNMVININHMSETLMAFPMEKKPSQKDLDELKESISDEE